MTRLAPALLVALLVAAPVACTGDDDDGTTTTDAATATDGTSAAEAANGEGLDVEALASYDAVSELADGLTAAGITCTLEYEGLRDAERELSLCVIEGEIAELSVWLDPTFVGAIATASDGTVALGANWTVDVETAATAQLVAAQLGGAAPEGG